MSLRYLATGLLLVVLLFSRARLGADELPVWAPIGPDGGHVQALAVSPALPEWILAGLQQGYGIYRSADRGRSWEAASDEFGRVIFDLAISANGRAFYAATSRGFLKSTDGGASWPAVSGEVYALVATHPRKSAIVFAAQGRFLVRSADGGVTFEAVVGPEEATKIAFAQTGRHTVVYAGAGNGLWRSTDDGRTWTEMGPPSSASPLHVQAVAVDPVDPRILYIGLLQGQRGLLFKSQDGGATWRRSQSGLPAGGSLPVSELAVDRTNPSVVYAVVGDDLFRSVNGGRDWSRPVPRIPGGYVSALVTTGYGVLVGTPAGVLLSRNRGSSWQFRVTGLAATVIDGMDIDHQEPARLYAADVPAGTFKSSNQGRPWLRLADLVTLPTVRQPLAVDPADPNVVYAGTANNFFKSTNGGRRWMALEPFHVCLNLTRIVIDPREPAHFFVSGQLRFPCLDPALCTFFRSLDAGATWQCLGTFSDFDSAGSSPLGIDPFTSALFAQRPLGLARSTDDGETWTYVGEPGWEATSFAASPLVEGLLWAGLGGMVARSRDGGAIWQSFSTGLPSTQNVMALAADPADPATLYAATRSSGVFKSTDAGETWSQAGIWPPGVPFRGALLVDPGNPGILYAGTDGLGVLRLDQSGD